MNKLLTLLLSAIVTVGFNVAAAHGNFKPAHGGTLQMVGETTIELVVLGDQAEVYLTDDGDPMDSAGMTGKLTVTSNGAKTEATLTPAGGNKLAASGVKIVAGAKVAVMVTRADQSKVGTTFVIK